MVFFWQYISIIAAVVTIIGGGGVIGIIRLLRKEKKPNNGNTVKHSQIAKIGNYNKNTTVSQKIKDQDND